MICWHLQMTNLCYTLTRYQVFIKKIKKKDRHLKCTVSCDMVLNCWPVTTKATSTTWYIHHTMIPFPCWNDSHSCFLLAEHRGCVRAHNQSQDLVTDVSSWNFSLRLLCFCLSYSSLAMAADLLSGHSVRVWIGVVTVGLYSTYE